MRALTRQFQLGETEEKRGKRFLDTLDKRLLRIIDFSSSRCNPLLVLLLDTRHHGVVSFPRPLITRSKE